MSFIFDAPLSFPIFYARRSTMALPNQNGKRFLSIHSMESADGIDGYPIRKSPRAESADERKENTKSEFTLSSLPEELLCNIMSFLDAKSLLETRCLNRSFRTLASQGDAGWDNLCQRLWADKVHVPREARELSNRMAAYRLSVEDARSRDFLTSEELLFDPITKKGTVWSFRFKESAGLDWTAWDPWYNGQPCRKMVFLEDGSVKEFRPDNNTAGGGNLEDPPFSERMGNLFDPPMAMSWRYLTQPLDMPARPRGSYIRFSVGGREVPTYCVRRSPTKNWGFIMESCWGVYSSFELPKRTPKTRRRRVRLRRAQDTQGNWFNVEVEASDDDSSSASSSTREGRPSSPSRLLIDDETFTVTSGLQWREAFMYNFGARELPEGDNAMALFDAAYAFLNA